MAVSTDSRTDGERGPEAEKRRGELRFDAAPGSDDQHSRGALYIKGLPKAA